MPQRTDPPQCHDLVGILGGMGPGATADFLHKLTQLKAAQCDQDHVPVLISSVPQIPDRTQAFCGNGPSPLPALVREGLRLQTAGVQLIAMPCNTAHLWFDALQAQVKSPMLHIVDETMKIALKTNPQHSAFNLGLLATDATISSGLYVNRAQHLQLKSPVNWLLPTAKEMTHWIMPGIAAVKSNQLKKGQQLLGSAAQALHQRGASALILACTEIPIVLTHNDCPIPHIDATSALASGVIAWYQARQNQTQIQAQP